MVIVHGDIRRTKALACWTLALHKLTLHIPVPLIDLAWFQTEAVLELSDFTLIPLRSLLEFSEQNFILLGVFPDPLLCFFGAFGSVADDNSWHKATRDQRSHYLATAALW